MARNIVNKKQLAIESNYGYMNIHLELLFKAKDDSEKVFQFTQLNKVRNALLKLGYFEKEKAK